MKTKKRAIEVLAVLALAVVWSSEGRVLAADSRVPPSIAGITVSFKLDPRLTRGLYMGDRWVAPPSYNSLSAEVGKSISVEARAQGLDAMGRRWRVNPEWIPSDPEMVTVSPARGSAVTITVRRAGESSVTLKSGEIIRKLTLQTVRQGETWRVDILQEAPVPKPPPARSRKPPPGPGVKPAAACSTPGAPAGCTVASPRRLASPRGAPVPEVLFGECNRMESDQLARGRLAAPAVLTVALVSALGAPAAAGADHFLLEEPLRPPTPGPSLTAFPMLLVAEERPSLDFDLLGEAKPPPEPANAGALRLRRKMLKVHQGLGLSLLGVQLATTAVGQLSYSDRFAGGPDTGRYRLTHKLLAYTTLGVFAVNGTIALLAPSAKTPRKFDRVAVHRLAMAAAAAGMATQAVLGTVTRERSGYLNQEKFATAHLVVGYVTLAAVLTGVGVIVF